MVKYKHQEIIKFKFYFDGDVSAVSVFQKRLNCSRIISLYFLSFQENETNKNVNFSFTDIEHVTCTGIFFYPLCHVCILFFYVCCRTISIFQNIM